MNTHNLTNFESKIFAKLNVNKIFCYVALKVSFILFFMAISIYIQLILLL